MKSFLTAGFALATCAAFAAMSEDFQDKGPGAITTGDWAGGTVEVSGSDKVLAIDGTVSCSNDTQAASSEFVKTSFKVFAPADATATTDLPSEGLTDCQIAIATGPEATGTNKLKVMVYGGASPAAWTDTGLTVATNDWFTVTLHFDYTAKTAKVEIGGEYSAPVALVNNAVVANNTAKINSLSFVGSSKIDNVSIDEAITKATLASTLDGLEIYAADLPEGVTAANLGEDNNYTKHIEAGLTPSVSDVTFNATALSTDSTQTVITVPCDKDYGQVYQVLINDGSATTTVSATAGAIKGSARALKFTVPPELTSKVLKFQVKVGVLPPLDS